MTAPVAPTTPSFVRPALAYLAGLGLFVVIVAIGTFVAAFVVVSGGDAQLQSNTRYVVALLAINFVAALIAGLATARMTTGRSLYTVFLLALTLVVSATVPLMRVTATASEPSWYPIMRPILLLVGVLGGGVLERLRSRPHQASQ